MLYAAAITCLRCCFCYAMPYCYYAVIIAILLTRCHAAIAAIRYAFHVSPYACHAALIRLITLLLILSPHIMLLLYALAATPLSYIICRCHYAAIVIRRYAPYDAC